MENDEITRLGTPDLKLEGLQIWVHGRQFPDLYDYWDGNWLRVTAHCRADSASVFANGSIIHLPELDRWLTDTNMLLRNLEGEAKLNCMEPALSVVFKSGSLGHVAMEVSITPNHMTQSHWFRFQIDQSYLPPFVTQCQLVLERYPIRGGGDT